MLLQILVVMTVELKQAAVCGISYANKKLVGLGAEADPRDFPKHVNLLTPAEISRHCVVSQLCATQHHDYRHVLQH